MIKQTFLAFALIWVVAVCDAQLVPNGSFENWSSPNEYLIPDNWETLNDMTSTANVYTASRGGTSSDYYLKLTTQIVPDMGVMPGVAVSGMLDMNSFAPLSGFPYSFLPTAFTGKWQYMASSSSDIGMVAVYLTKWNTDMNMRDTVGYAMQNLGGMQMSWTNFSLPFTYISSLIPDSCTIYMNSSGNIPEAGGYLYVDNLDFTGIVTSVEGIETTGLFKVYPNPSNDLVNMDLSGLKSFAEQFEVLDFTGKVLLSQKSNGSLLQSISLSEFSTGSYFLRIYTANGVVTQKISKQ